MYTFPNAFSDLSILSSLGFVTGFLGENTVQQSSSGNIDEKAIGLNCKDEEMTIISRRFMMRIAQIIFYYI